MPAFITATLVVPDSELDWRFSTSGGPGGQHANKAETRVEVAWDIEASSVVSDDQREHLIRRLGPVVRASCDDHRSQHRNRTEAVDRLGTKVRDALAPPPRPRKATRPSRGAQRRRLQKKRRRKQTKQLRRPPTPDE